MLEIKGRYANAKVYTKDLEDKAREQVEELLEQSFMQEANPRFMPDAHAGKGCVIGTTFIVKDEICPNLVGVDIACGVLVVALHGVKLEPKKLDRVIHDHVPAGFKTHVKAVNERMLKDRFDFSLEDLKSYYELLRDTIDRARKSFGTLGGGNHFIELAVSEKPTSSI